MFCAPVFSPNTLIEFLYICIKLRPLFGFIKSASFHLRTNHLYLIPVSQGRADKSWKPTQVCSFFRVSWSTTHKIHNLHYLCQYWMLWFRNAQLKYAKALCSTKQLPLLEKTMQAVRLFCTLLQRRFVTSVRDGMENVHKDGIRVGYTGGNSREYGRQPASASKNEDISPVEHKT